MSFPFIPLSAWPAIVPRELLPIHPVPADLIASLPPLPSPKRQPAFHATWSLSTHLFPACHIRTSPKIPVPTLPTTDDKGERKNWATRTAGQLLKPNRPKADLGTPQVLWNCVNRYRKKAKSSEGVTLFFVHANGLPKETWEPTLETLLASSACECITEIWTWETVQHGDAALVNAASLSGAFDWIDNARDILNFLLHFLPASSSSSALPTHLRQVSSEETESRIVNGYQNRSLLVTAHSFGGCTSAIAASVHPTLFQCLVLIDPVIVKPVFPKEKTLPDPRSPSLVQGALLRRGSWPSREEAYALFTRSPFFSAWDPRTLRLYVEWGLYPSSELDGQGKSTPVHLKTSPAQEAIVFGDTYTRGETWERVAHYLDEKVELVWIMPGKDGHTIGKPGSMAERVWLRPRNSSNHIVVNAGHLIPQEKPDELARLLAAIVHKKYSKSQVKASL